MVCPLGYHDRLPQGIGWQPLDGNQRCPFFRLQMRFQLYQAQGTEGFGMRRI